MLRIYIIGLSILLIAIIANIIAGRLNIMTWYDYIGNISKQGVGAVNGMSIVDALWLFIFYPLFLGLGYYLGHKLYTAIFN